GLWGGSGASTNSLSDTYRGPGPFSEPEAQAVRELVGTRQVVTLISNHTYSNLVLRPPGVLDFGFPLEEPQLAALGARMASRNGCSNTRGLGRNDTTETPETWPFGPAGAVSYPLKRVSSQSPPPFETGVVAEYLGLAPAAGAGRGGNRAAYYDMLEATA